MSSTPWWERHPGLLEWELQQLEDADIPYKRDEAWERQHRAIRLEVHPEVGGRRRPMHATYPDDYPWFRPEVVAPDEQLAEHQGPFEKNLCLLDRSAAAWDPTTDSLTRLLVEQVPKVFEPQDVRHGTDLEVHQAEPFAAWYSFSEGGLIVDGSWTLGNCDSGTFEYGLARFHPTDGPIVGFVLRVADGHGETLAEADQLLLDRFAEAQTYRGRWSRLIDAPHVQDGEGLRQVLRRSDRQHRASLAEPVGGGPNAARIDLSAAVFADHADYDGATADAWLFTATLHPPGTNRSDRRHSAGTTRLLCGMRGGRGDLAVRVPELAPLATKGVAVFGIGGVGAPSAIEFAKAGVAILGLVDHDHVEPASEVRYPLGHGEAGRQKVTSLSEFLSGQFPLVNVRAASARIGGVRLNGEGMTQGEALDQVLEGTNLIYDATGDHGLSLFLCEVARDRRLAYVAASTTLGAWGARVLRVHPTDGPCYNCLLLHITDQERAGTAASEDSFTPAADPNGEIRPIGCGDATFTGAGFDVAQAAIIGVRASVSTLCEGDTGYPSTPWNVAVVNFRDQDGASTAGRAHHHVMHRHPACELCERRFG